MSYGTGNDLVAEVKAHNRIVTVIESYVTLKKAGKDYVGLCPFHDDKNPSMKVNDDKGLFHCFACGEGGDVIAFYMKYNNLDFSDALRELAAKAGIKYIKRESSPRINKKNNSVTDSLYSINTLAEKLYIKYLHESGDGKTGLKYLMGRGLNTETINLFRLGLSPDNWSNLVRILKKKGISLNLAERTGLIIKKNGVDDYYDRFRGRIMFPIYDLNNKIAGFGGRTLKDDSNKYLNSPETDIYSKSKILYGLNITRSFIRAESTAIVVEGYMDLLTLYNNGINNVVATLGTSITGHHASLLKRIADRVVICYDGDNAGANASYRAMDIFHAEGIIPLILKLPKNEDPASFILKNGHEKFREMLKQSSPLIDIYFEDTVNKFNTNRKTRSSAVNDIIERLNKMTEDVDRSYYIRKTAETFAIREEALYKLIKPGNYDIKSIAGKQLTERSYEFMLLKVLIMFPELKAELEEDIIELIIDESIKTILKVYFEHDNDIANMINYFDDSSLKSILTEIFFTNNDITDFKTANKIYKDCIKRTRLMAIKAELSRIKYNLSLKNKSTDHDKLIREYRDLVKKEKSLINQSYEL